MPDIRQTPGATVSVAYHSRHGHTAVLAAAVADGARQTGARTHVLAVDRVDDDGWRLLDASDAIVFGCPTYMGNVSSEFQAFAEATSRRWLDGAWRDKVAAGFSNSGCLSGDKLQVLQALAILAAQHGMHWVNLGLKPGYSASTDSMNDPNRLGIFLGAGAQTPADLGDEGVHPSDLETCRLLGRRVAGVSAALTAGTRLPADGVRTGAA
ncbi:flavodoxin family protein [Streptomyces alanosinicus]|uniref:FMN reductase n=1 Tax=Streptomyces alanosinicus TaxID=68171 RepID=A0A918YRQ0_9ACTN|nr:flavodoxin family protein [Streptomyces alanosinicus]GHE13589.1 FMN reductase [Streptomyces alanosinicus]